MTRRPTLLLAIPLLFVLSACAPGGGATGGDGDGSGGDGAAGGTDASAACAAVADGGYELFVDPRLTVEPSQDVYQLAAEGDSVAFTDVPPDGEYTTYGYSTYYIDNGSAFPNDAGTFVGAEDTQTFTLDGPMAPSGVDGGPYAGIIEIDATTLSASSTIARICVQFGTSD